MTASSRPFRLDPLHVSLLSTALSRCVSRAAPHIPPPGPYARPPNLHPALWTLLLVMISSAGRSAVAQEPMRSEMHDRYMRFWDYVVGGSVEPHWLADGSSFWFATGAPESRGIYRVDPSKGCSSNLGISILQSGTRWWSRSIRARRLATSCVASHPRGIGAPTTPTRRRLWPNSASSWSWSTAVAPRSAAKPFGTPFTRTSVASRSTNTQRFSSSWLVRDHTWTYRGWESTAIPGAVTTPPGRCSSHRSSTRSA